MEEAAEIFKMGNVCCPSTCNHNRHILWPLDAITLFFGGEGGSSRTQPHLYFFLVIYLFIVSLDI